LKESPPLFPSPLKITALPPFPLPCFRPASEQAPSPLPPASRIRRPLAPLFLFFPGRRRNFADYFPFVGSTQAPYDSPPPFFFFLFCPRKVIDDSSASFPPQNSIEHLPVVLPFFPSCETVFISPFEPKNRVNPVRLAGVLPFPVREVDVLFFPFARFLQHKPIDRFRCFAEGVPLFSSPPSEEVYRRKFSPSPGAAERPPNPLSPEAEDFFFFPSFVSDRRYLRCF